MEREKDVNQAFARLALYRERDRPDYIRLFPVRSPRGPCNTAQKPRRSSSDALFHICPCGNKVPEELQQGEGLAGFHPPFPFPLAAEALATPRKSHVGLRPTHFFVYKPLRKQSSRGTPTAKGISRISSAFSLPLATEALATPRKSHIGLRPTHFLVYKPLRERSSRRTPTAKGISRISSAFSLPLATEALATPRKSHVGLRPPHFFIYMPLRKQSSRGAYIRKKPNLKLGFCLCCGERGSRTYIFKKYHKIANH